MRFGGALRFHRFMFKPIIYEKINDLFNKNFGNIHHI